MAAVFLLVVLAGLPSAGAVLSLDAITVETGDTTLTSTSFTHETPSGEDRLLLVSASWDDDNDVNLSSITYDGNSLTCLDPAKQSPKVASQMCYLVAPPTGSNTLDLGWTADVPEWAIVVRSLTDVDQSNPLGATSQTSGNGTSAVDTLTTEEPDSTVFAHVGAEDADVSLDAVDDTVEDTETTAGLSSLGISAAAGRINTTTAGDYDIGWNLSTAEAWALDPAEVRRSPERVFFNESSSSGDESTSPVSVVIAMDRKSSGDVKVDYAWTNGNASGDDHDLSNGTAVIDSGRTSTTLTFNVTDDDADEPNETIDIELKNPRGGATSSPTTHTFTIVDDDANAAPNPDDASVSTDEDQSVLDTVTASDPDQNDTIASFAVDQAPSHGSLSFDQSNGDFTYSPDADYNGDDAFTFTATDEHGATSANATVDITVDSVNDAPVAEDDSAATDEDRTVWVDVLANDSDVDGDTLSVASATSPANGSTSLPGNGTVEYTPDADWNGEDSFAYDVTDGSLTARATVNVTVNAVNDAPTAGDDGASTDEDTSVTVDVLANDTDVDGDTLSVASTTAPSNGSASVNADDTITYTPDADWNGEDSFTYDVTDGTATVTATVDVTVDAVNDAPSASDDGASTDEDETVWVDVLANDSDVDGDTLSVASVTSPSNGSTSLPGNGTVEYTPDADWNGEDSFAYDVTDGSLTARATVNVTVNAVNDAPVAQDDDATTAANETVWVDVLANDTDVDDTSLTVASATSPANGTTSLPGNGTVEYTPDPGFSGEESFAYDVTDGSLTDAATVNVTVGSGGGTEILASSVRVLDADLDTKPTLRTRAAGSSVFLQLENATGGIDLRELGASNTTTIEINLTTANFTPTTLMGRTQVVDWTNTTNENGTENVSLELQPIAMAFIDDCDTYDPFMGYCGPSSTDAWPTNASEDEADVSFEAGLRVFLSDLSYLNATMRDRLQGAYMTTDAQALGRMNISGADSPGGPSLEMPVAGPHTRPDGSQNDGFFEARLPDGMLSWWGIDEPSRLTGEYEGENRSVEISDVDGGTLVRMDIHYSSGEVNITEDTTDPEADAGADRTVDEGASLELDGGNSTDNQGVTNYTWTMGDGTTLYGETVEHTYDDADTYEVVLNVSDGSGNADEDAVNVTVESSGGGGGGGGVATDADEQTGDADTTEETDETDETTVTTTGSGADTGDSQADENQDADDRDLQRAASDEETDGSPSSAGESEPSGETEGSLASRVTDQGVEVGAWLVWLLLVPISVIGIRRYRR